MNLKSIAENAVRILALEFAPGNWPTIDRIERRFKIQGCAETIQRRARQDSHSFIEKETAARTTWEDKLWLT